MFRLFQKWNLTVEEVLENGKCRTLASAPLNLSDFVNETNARTSRLKWKLDRLKSEVVSCMILLVVTSTPATNGNTLLFVIIHESETLNL